MSIAVITGSAGLIGSEAVAFLHDKGMRVVGIDNDLRRYFFGAEASTRWKAEELKSKLPNYEHHSIDIRESDKIFQLFRRLGKDISLIIHAAAQPSHDWAAQEPLTDFTVNANGTLVLLEATRQYCPDAVFIFTSTNKVYGDRPNTLPLVELETRWEIEPAHPYFKYGIDETMPIDNSLHSLFGVSKAAADLLAQEYGQYFGLKTGVFRGGCLTGPAHSSAELHGFLAYLVKCAVTGSPYTIYGYKGKQVRDNIHAFDLVNAFWHFFQNPRCGEIYNIGGSRHSNCSMLEAIKLIEMISGRQVRYSISPKPRTGDHVWWISDVSKFQKHYPEWTYEYDLRKMTDEIVAAASKRIKTMARGT
ncbi:MAG: NAD-dependent epimerase [Acidobacteria bacterium]|nr:MAG: NAD-dependent epimerase [Acidobacteriota bacterium]